MSLQRSGNPDYITDSVWLDRRPPDLFRTVTTFGTPRRPPSPARMFMPRPISWRLTRYLAGAFLTLLAWNLVTPGSAFAGCVHDRPTVSHFEGLIHAGAMSEPADVPSAQTLPGLPPTCTGPLCSRGPAAPPPAPWASTASVRDSWAYLVEILDPAPSLTNVLPPEARLDLPSPCGPSVFHPPRIAAN